MEYYLPSRTIQREVEFMWRKYMQELENLRKTRKEPAKEKRSCIVTTVIRHTRRLIMGRVEGDILE